MIGLYNKDSSYFDIFSPDIDMGVISDDIISFSVREEIGKITEGSLTLHDPLNKYSRFLRMGVKLIISWGYLKPDLGPQALLAALSNPGEKTGIMNRDGLICYVKNPGGTGTPNGVITYQCSFYAQEVISGGRSKVWKNMTRSVVISQVLLEMGVIISNQEILFKTMTRTIEPNKQLVQYESNFRFLLRLASWWGALFRIGYVSGLPFAMFIDPDKISTSKFSNIITTSVGTNIGLNYAVEGADKSLCNVMSFNWRNLQGDGGAGDNVQIKIINGQPVFERYIVQNDSIVTWRMRPDKIRTDLQKAGSITNQIKLMKNWLNTQDFQTLVDQGYFYKVTDTTAPQGLGYTVKCKVIGNPLMTSPCRVEFGTGFPDFFSNKRLMYYMRSVEHSIDRDGYFCDLDIVDALTITGGSYI